MFADVGVSWFPQGLAVEFFVLKGIVALLSTILLVAHMNRSRGQITRNGTMAQRLRYLCLLSFSILVTGASTEQVQESALVSYRHLGSLAVTIFLLVTSVISIREDGRKPRTTRSSAL